MKTKTIKLQLCCLRIILLNEYFIDLKVLAFITLRLASQTIVYCSSRGMRTFKSINAKKEIKSI